MIDVGRIPSGGRQDDDDGRHAVERRLDRSHRCTASDVSRFRCQHP